VSRGSNVVGSSYHDVVPDDSIAPAEQSGFNSQVLRALSSLFPYHKLMPVAVCPCRSGS